MATNTSSNNMAAAPATIKDKIRQALRGKRINLWEEPYVNKERESVQAALEELVESWRTDSVLADVDLSNPATKQQALRALGDWQAHALEKWRAKQEAKEDLGASSKSPTSVIPNAARLGDAKSSHNAAAMMTLELKVLGLKNKATDAGNTVLIESACASSDNDFCSAAYLVAGNNGTRTGPVVLRIEGVSTRHTGAMMVDFVKTRLEVSSLKLIRRGKTIADGGESRAAATLGEIFQISSDKSSGKHVVVGGLLCLVSSNDAINSNNDRLTKHVNIHARINTIRDAARQLRDTTNLDIVDQHGSTVPMTKEDRLGFVTALALHRMGMHHHEQKEDSLVLLLEADAEWNSHPNLQTWKDRVDNYGFLQLDIAWLYLQLESLSNLPDSLQRLEQAEKVLRKQVNSNFVTLAVAQAQLGNSNAVPPLAAVFAKLFLLQGIAYSHDGQNKPSSFRKGKERLDEAFFLLQSLRSVAPEESVDRLLLAMGSSSSGTDPTAGLFPARTTFTRADAIAALRTSRGNLDAAAIALSESVSNRQQRLRDRETQRKHGLCDNEADPVNLTAVEALEPMLFRDGADSVANGVGTDLAVGLLRLANNDLGRALEVYKEKDYDSHKVLALVGALDQRLIGRGLLDRATLARNKRRKYDQLPMDEMALARLVSMGVQDGKARRALQKNSNDFENSLLWLSQVDRQDVAQPRTSDEDGHEASRGNDDGESTQESLADELESNDIVQHFDDVEPERNAKELLYEELGDILEDRDLEKEYLGNSLDDEWRLVQKYRPPNTTRTHEGTNEQWNKEKNRK